MLHVSKMKYMYMETGKKSSMGICGRTDANLMKIFSSCECTVNKITIHFKFIYIIAFVKISNENTVNVSVKKHSLPHSRNFILFEHLNPFEHIFNTNVLKCVHCCWCNLDWLGLVFGNIFVYQIKRK